MVTISLFLGGFVAYTMSAGDRQPQPSIISTTTETPVETLDILVVGDIMLSRNVARHAEKS